MTLVLIAVLSLATEAMTRWVSGALAQAFAHREEVEAKRQIAEGQSVAMYLLATRPISSRGVELLTFQQLRLAVPTGPMTVAAPGKNYLHLDDSPYRLGDTVLRFQDGRGLINLNIGSDNDLFALLGTFGVSSAERQPLIAKLQDYIDDDQFVRLNGAEARQYKEVGREPPTDAPLRTPWEVRRILDWDKIEGIAREDSGWPLLAATFPLGGFNINTAPQELIALMPGMMPDTVAKVVSWRRGQPIGGKLDLARLTGVRLPDDPLRDINFPANSLVLTLSSQRWPLERRIAVRLTPKSRDHPWVIDYDVELPRPLRTSTEPVPDDLPVSQLLSTIP